MEKINLDKEWIFIKEEIHKIRSIKDNFLKRELLFILQILLSNPNSFNLSIYFKSKNKYLSLT